MNLPEKMENGRYPAFAFPGGYPIIYVLADNAVICPECANGDNGSEASPEHEEKMWRLVACDIHYEGYAETCAHCNALIHSAYGDPDEDYGPEHSAIQDGKPLPGI